MVGDQIQCQGIHEGEEIGYTAGPEKVQEAQTFHYLPWVHISLQVFYT